VTKPNLRCLFVVGIFFLSSVLFTFVCTVSSGAEAPAWNWKQLVLLFGEEQKEYVVEMKSSSGGLYTTTPFPGYPSCSGCFTVIDVEGKIHRVVDESGKNLPEYDWVKGRKSVDLPLAKGKKWSVWATIKDPDGKIRDYYISNKVGDVKTIKIAAGEFEVFEVEREVTLRDRSWSAMTKVYYAPALNLVVKYIGPGNHRWELKSIQ